MSLRAPNWLKILFWQYTRKESHVWLCITFVNRKFLLADRIRPKKRLSETPVLKDAKRKFQMSRSFLQRNKLKYDPSISHV